MFHNIHYYVENMTCFETMNTDFEMLYCENCKEMRMGRGSKSHNLQNEQRGNTNRYIGLGIDLLEISFKTIQN